MISSETFRRGNAYLAVRVSPCESVIEKRWDVESVTIYLFTPPNSHPVRQFPPHRGVVAIHRVAAAVVLMHVRLACIQSSHIAATTN